MEIHNVEQNTEEWYALRTGRPTASEFKKVITGTGAASKQLNSYAATLAAELYAGGQLERWDGNQWTERGHELEPEAKAGYELLMGAVIEPVGFVTNAFAGASPDGLVSDAGLFEGKCLSPHQHVMALAYHAKHGRAEPDYIPQVQGQLWVTDRQWCDLFFYHPQLPELTIRIERDQEFIASLDVRIQLLLEKRDEYCSTLKAAA